MIAHTESPSLLWILLSLAITILDKYLNSASQNPNQLKPIALCPPTPPSLSVLENAYSLTVHVNVYICGFHGYYQGQVISRAPCSLLVQERDDGSLKCDRKNGLSKPNSLGNVETEMYMKTAHRKRGRHVGKGGWVGWGGVLGQWSPTGMSQSSLVE